MNFRSMLSLTLISLAVNICCAQEYSNGVTDRGSSCVINSWLWEGELGTDFLESLNWFNCGFVDGPTTNVPIYIGPIEHFFQGIPQEITYPKSPAFLQSDFTNPGLTMANGVDTFFTIQNATYTSHGIIGTPHQTAGSSGLATLTLDNSIWNGNLSISVNGGNGRLCILGHSQVTGLLDQGDESEVQNKGFFEVVNSSYSPSITGASWDNDSGSTLTLANTINGNFPFAGLSGNMLVNSAGATITKTQNSSTSIQWAYEGEGNIEIQAGRLTFNQSVHADEMPIDVSPGASIDLASSELISDDGQLDLISSQTDQTDLFFKDLTGSADLVLRGNYNLNLSSSPQLGVDIVNDGRAEFIGNTQFHSGGTTGRTWTNLAGSEMILSNTFNGSYPFTGFSGNTLVNSAGATITKTENSTTSIQWLLVNEGTIDIQTGTLSLISAAPSITMSSSSVLKGLGTLDTNSIPTLINNGTLIPGVADPQANPNGLTIDIPEILSGLTSVFSIQIGTNASKLTCTGLFELGGTIDVQPAENFKPDGSEEFTVLVADNVSATLNGYFENANPSVGSIAENVRTNGLEYDVEYSSDSISIMNISLYLPCSPADLTGDGTLDIFDVLEFITAYNASDPIADLTGDGSFDIFDVLEFVTLYNAGC
jgi:hypothetical protein